MLKFTVVSLTGLLLLAGCNSAPPAPATPAVDIAGEQGKIRDLESAWVAAAAAKDLDKIMSYYADDAILITPGAPAAKSRDAIRRAWKGLLADPKIKLAFSSERVAISTSGDMGLLTVPIP
jgi:ketosteroid isomerase-like protein